MHTVEIVTGAAGATRPAAGAWVLLPSEEMRDRWRREFPELAAGLRTLPELARELAGLALEGWEVIRPAFRLLILRQLVREHVRPEDYFGRVTATTGFVRRLADLIAHLKQSEVDADALAGAVGAAAPDLPDPFFARKGAEIAALLRRYDAYLTEHRLCDAEDLLAHAVAHLRASESSSGLAALSTLVVEGFFVFTPLQLSLLQALARRFETLRVSLPHDPSRPVLFARTAETVARLRERFPAAVITERPAGEPSGGVRRLERQFMRGEAPARPAGEAVLLFAAPDELTQVEMAAREIRRLLDRGGYRPPEVGVIARSWNELGPTLRNVFGRYEIPFRLHGGERLDSSPLVRCLSALLRVWLYDWQRDDLLRLARSSCLSLDGLLVSALEQQARRQGVRHGRARWLAIAGGESETRFARLLCQVADGQDRLRATRSPAEFCQALRDALLALGLLKTAPEAGAAVPAPEDAEAWKSAWNILVDLCRLSPVSAPAAWSVEELAEAVLTGWAEGFFTPVADEAERVQVLEAYDVRGYCFRAVFLLDMVEGRFPRPPREDPFFRDDERQALARRSPVVLPLSLAQADEERLLFYQTLAAAEERLFLSYPLTREDQPALRSFFLDEVEKAIAPLPAKVLTLADAFPGPEEAVLPRERLAALAAALGDGRRPDDPGAPEALRRLAAGLREELPGAVERLLAPPDAGRAYQLSHPAVRSHWRRGRAYTVSELEAALGCPFQHYLGYRLKLAVAVEGAGSLDQGQIVHEVLRQFFTEARASGFPDRAGALDRLRRLCREQFDAVPLDARPYRIRLAERALERYLEGFLDRELQYREAARMETAYLEFGFGPQEGRGPVDPASIAQPLVLRGGEAEVRLSGKIDRIDCTSDGGALVFDYKLGKARSRKEILEGESLQMPVYWLAVEQILGLTPVGGAYDALREGERPVMARCDLADRAFADKALLGKNALGKAPFEQLLERTRRSVIAAAAMIERLEVMPAPSEPETCARCRYRDCCRPEDAGLVFAVGSGEGTADD